MNFLDHLTSFYGAVLLAWIVTVVAGGIWTGLHGDAQGKPYFYAWPLVWLIVLIVLIVAWARIVFA